MALLTTIKTSIGLLWTTIQIGMRAGKWLGTLRSRRIASLAAAIDIAERRYIPNLRKQITTFLSDVESYDSIENAAKTYKPNLAPIEAALSTHLHLPDELATKRHQIAIELTSALVLEMQKQVLATESAIVHANDLAEQRSSALTSQITSIEDILTGRRIVPSFDLIDKVKDFANGKSRREIFAIWQTTMNHIVGTNIAADIRVTVITQTGIAAWNVGEMVTAQDLFDRAFEISPSLPLVKIGRALSLGLRKQFDDAEKTLTQARQPANEHLILGALAQILLFKGEHDRIARLIEQHEVISDDASMLRRVYVSSLLQQHRFDEVVALLKQTSFKSTRGDEPAFLGIATVGAVVQRLQRGYAPATVKPDLDEAKKTLESALAQALQNNERNAILECAINLCLAEEFLGNREHAQRYLRIASDNASEAKELQRIAFAAVRIGAFASAHDALTRVPPQDIQT